MKTPSFDLNNVLSSWIHQELIQAGYDHDFIPEFDPSSEELFFTLETNILSNCELETVHKCSPAHCGYECHYNLRINKRGKQGEYVEDIVTVMTQLTPYSVIETILTEFLTKNNLSLVSNTKR